MGASFTIETLLYNLNVMESSKKNRGKQQLTKRYKKL